MPRRRRNTYFLIGPPHAIYRHACSFRHWPADLPRPSNDDRAPVARRILAVLRRLIVAACSATGRPTPLPTRGRVSLP